MSYPFLHLFAVGSASQQHQIHEVSLLNGSPGFEAKWIVLHVQAPLAKNALSSQNLPCQDLQLLVVKPERSPKIQKK